MMIAQSKNTQKIADPLFSMSQIYSPNSVALTAHSINISTLIIGGKPEKFMNKEVA